MPVKDVLITDYVHPLLLTGLHERGFSTTYAPEMTRQEMETILPKYKGVVINTRCSLSRAAIGNAPNLLWIARLGSGLDIIDLEAAAEQNVRVISAPEGNAQAVAEHAMGMLLTLTNKIIQADRTVREGQWLREEHRGWELDGKTVGIIGYGNNGSAFGRLWKGWNTRILAYDKYLHSFGTEYIRETDLPTLKKEADVISLHVPLTPETKEMVDATFISGCKPGFILINTSRGWNINLRDVVQGLRSGNIGGACLDVLPYEPPTKGPNDFQEWFAALAGIDNVVLSPHIAGWTTESKKKIAEFILCKL